MILQRGPDVVEIGMAQYPLNRKSELVQVRERSASGVTYTEDFSIQIGAVTYNFSDMSADYYIALMEFFVNSAEGMLHEFKIVDDRGAESTVKFTTPTLAFNETFMDLWEGSFTVEEIT